MTLQLNLKPNKPSLLQSQGTAGIVFYMTVEQAHSHENSSVQSSVSTLETFIQEIALQQKMKKGKKIFKVNPKKPAPANWTKAQISLLVKLLRQHGSDFTTIATYMTKTRDQIKRKFKVFEKKHPALADAIFQRQTSQQQLQMMVEENDFLIE